eukprot:CAMPEP_0183373418 /NCGR_PEP_ID=MMETSP0164_2-20130417/111358_1 /TAXON_ID=221442 /ORGANISM="Coccolithus pelagicus ssp braarudi, Strain PLY182g" /LENGTH=130 /DNA_ID=CAMNT_0025550295 /DNA_START=372 /DNA_END=764 /DNA_ORIENTATION=-
MPMNSAYLVLWASSLRAAPTHSSARGAASVVQELNRPRCQGIRSDQRNTWLEDTRGASRPCCIWNRFVMAGTTQNFLHFGRLITEAMPSFKGCLHIVSSYRSSSLWKLTPNERSSTNAHGTKRSGPLQSA